MAEEKLEIANQYLIPAALKESGINNDQVTLKEGTIEQLLKGYCRESGVRSLKKHIEKVQTFLYNSVFLDFPQVCFTNCQTGTVFTD